MQENKSQYFIPISIIIAGALIALAVFLNKPAPAAPASGQAAPGQVAVNIKNVSTTGDPFIGNQNAPVTVAEWTDYQCPFCKRFEVVTPSSTPVLPDLIKNYVATGKVKIVFKDYQFLGPDSMTAALFARAVWDLYPDKYFEWRTAMYNAQDGENTGFGNEASIVALTKTISGIDTTKVEQQITQKKDQYQNAVTADMTEGSKFGVTGTPSFIVGTQLISGGLDYPSFSQLLDAQLK